MTRYLVAVDAGTSMIKAVLVSEDGVVHGMADAPVVRDENPGLDPTVFWQTTASVLATLVAAHPEITPDGVVVAGQGDGLWMLGANCTPVARSYLWNGTEAADVVATWASHGLIDKHFSRCGTALWPGSQAALWAWYRDSHPELAKDVTVAFCAKDFINFCLTGVVATDPTDASIPFLDPHTEDYSQEAAELLGVSDLLSLCPPIVASGAPLGEVHRSASQLTGLPEGTPVYQGALDVVAMLWGSGLGQPGDVLAVLGTTAVSMTVTEEKNPGSDVSGATLTIGDGSRLRVMGSSAGTATLEWYMQLAGYDQVDRYDWLWKDVESGHDGEEIFIPYLAGERAPILAPHATGTFLGVTTSTTPQRMARAVTEGITHALRWGIDSVLHQGSTETLGTVVLAGGGSQATGWASQVANCLGVPIVVDGRGDLGARGVARAVFGSLGDTVANGDVVRVVPDERQALIAQRHRSFLAAVKALLPLWSQDNSPQGSDGKDNRVN